MAMTVTATIPDTANFFGGIQFQVLVITGGLAAGGNGYQSSTDQASSFALTPAQTKSLLCWQVGNAASNMTFTAAGNNTIYSQHDFTAFGTYTGTVTASSPVTCGAVNTGTVYNDAGWEIIPSVGGVSPVIDASTPAVVNVINPTTYTATTASFTPPAGAVLVAMCTANNYSTGTGLAPVITDSSGLTWTVRESEIGTATGNLPMVIATAPISSGSTAAVAGAGAVTATAKNIGPSTAAAAGAGRVSAVAIGGYNLAAWNSLRIGNDIELLGDPAGSATVNPACPGADFNLQPGYDLGVAQSITDVVAALAIDGDRPLGRRAGNRKLSIPIHITAPTFAIMAAAREYLLQTVNQDTWQLTWTRAQDAEPNPLPMVIECFRAGPPGTGYGGVDTVDRNPVWPVTINCEALPYGRSDTPVQLVFPSPLQGQIAPTAWTNIDPYTTVTSTTQASSWSRSGWPDNGSAFPYSARWNRDGGSAYPVYTRTLPSAKNIAGYTTLSIWIGLGTDTWSRWHEGPVTFSFTLTDTASHTVTFGGTQWCTATSCPGWPQDQRLTFGIPVAPGFDFTQVASYSAAVWTEGAGVSRLFARNTTDVYLNCLGAWPPVAGSAAVGTTRGAVYRLQGVLGSARSPLSLQFQQPDVPGTSVATFTTPGQSYWTPPAGVTDPTGLTLNTVQGEVTGSAGAGSRRTTTGTGGGATGGEYAANLTLPVIPGVPVPVFVGAAGITGGAPLNGGDSSIGGWDETAGGVVGHGGLSAAANSATAAAGNTATSISPIHYRGGYGANGGTTGGGGGSGASAAGNGGDAAAGVGGTPPTGGGAGGAGAAAGGNNTGGAGSAPGGASGGGVSIGGTGNGGAAAVGKAVISWTGTVPAFKTLITHRPGPGSPTTFMPVVPVGNGADTPNGGTEYLIASPDPDSSLAAKYNGTYTVVLVSSSWNNPSAARDLTVTFRQYDYAGGPSVTMPVGGATPSRTVTPSSSDPTIGITNGLAVLGEITLPLRDIGADNTTAYLSAYVTSSNTNDRFLDVILLDTGGSTVAISVPGTGFANYFIDEPGINRGLGRILGSAYDRSQARSVLDSMLAVSGGPMTVDPGDNTLMAYCVEGAPSCYATYTPRFWLDRTV